MQQRAFLKLEVTSAMLARKRAIYKVLLTKLSKTMRIQSGEIHQLSDSLIHS